MTRFHFEQPDGPPSNNAQNILVHLNEFVPPEGYGVSPAPPIGISALVQTGTLSAIVQTTTLSALVKTGVP